MADPTPKSYSADPTLYLYTSLTAGSSHIITATSRLETILKANKIPFRALDVATDEKARMLWGRRSKGRNLPGLVKFGSILGDLDEVEEWNEYGELKQQIGGVLPVSAAPLTPTLTPPSKNPATRSSASETTSTGQSSSPHISIRDPTPERDEALSGPPRRPSKDNTPLSMAMRQAGAAAAKQAEDKRTVTPPTQMPEETDLSDVESPPREAMPGPTLAKSANDPTTSLEATAAKHPAILAAESAKRTTLDKIAEAKDTAETVPNRSKEESLLEARTTSSITKNNFPLATGSAAGSAASLGERREAQDLHHGSSMPTTSEEETDKAEEKLTKSEEDDGSNKERSVDAKGDLVGVTSSDKGERLAAEDLKPQEQDPKEGEAAGMSVGD